jgi:uncharacterized membrane protein
MVMGLRRWDAFAVLAFVGALSFAALVYDRLPDPVPTHFDLEGNPNGWMPKNVACWALPVFGLVLWSVVRFVVRILPRGDRGRLNEGLVSFVAMLAAVFVAAVQIVLLYAAAVPGTSVMPPVFVLGGGLFVALGLIMPRVRRNPIIGIRTAWTLTSDENWARTHRVAGYSMVAGGVFGTVAGLAGTPVGAGLAIAAWLLGALVPTVYSLVLARRSDAS